MKNYNFHLFFYTIWGDKRQSRIERVAKKLGAKIEPGWTDSRIIVRIPVNEPFNYCVFLWAYRLQVRYQHLGGYSLRSPGYIVAHRPFVDIYKGRKCHRYREAPLVEVVILWVINLALRLLNPLIVFVKKRLPKSS